MIWELLRQQLVHRTLPERSNLVLGKLLCISKDLWRIVGHTSSERSGGSLGLLEYIFLSPIWPKIVMILIIDQQQQLSKLNEDARSPLSTWTIMNGSPQRTLLFGVDTWKLFCSRHVYFMKQSYGIPATTSSQSSAIIMLEHTPSQQPIKTDRSVQPETQISLITVSFYNIDKIDIQ